MKVEVRNSFSKMIDVVDPNVTQLLTEVLTYKNEIDAEKSQLFYQLKRAKRFNNKRVYFSTLARIKYLEENEYVCLYQKDGTFPTGLLNIVLESLKVLEADYEYVDLRIDPGSSAILRWNNLPWEPRYYQDEMIKLGEIHKRGVFEAAVGSGKSLVMAYLVKLFSVNSLIVVPSTGLGEQLYNEFCNWFGYANVEQLDAKKIRKLKRVKPISIITVQSLGSLVKTGEIEEFLSQIDALYVDEFETRILLFHQS